MPLKGKLPHAFIAAFVLTLMWAAAHAVSLDTLLSLRERAPRPKKSPEEARADAGLKGALVSAFTDLPPDAQERLLEYEWPQVAGPEMLPVLRRIYENPPQRDQRLKDVSLRRIAFAGRGESARQSPSISTPRTGACRARRSRSTASSPGRG